MQRNMMVSWVVFAAWILVGIVGNLYRELGATTWSIQFCLLALFAVIHGSVRYRLSGGIAYFVIVFLTAMVFEAISIQTGFPFGFYTHTDAFGVKVFEVPVLVGVAFVGNAYISWMTARVLLDGALNRDEDGMIGLVGLPVVAALITAALDATYDPGGSTFAQMWHFRDGGGYFGVPFSNFVGWVVTSYVFFQIFALYKRKQGALPVENKWWWAMPPIMLFIYGAQQPINLLALANVTLTDPAGVSWQSQHLFVTTTLVSISTVIFCSIVAGLLIAGRKQD